MRPIRPIALSLVLVMLLAATTRAENWPQWRGVRNDGISGETNLPAKWANDEGVAWKLPLPGPAGSTPVIWGDRIFLTSVDGGDFVLLCASTEGKQLWSRKLGSGNRDVRGDEGNGASASPSTDGKHVWGFVSSGDLACYDFEGNQVWAANLQERYGRFNIAFGLTSTPVLDGDRLYFQLIHSGGAWVLALDKTTGKEVWKVERKSDGTAECEHSYASPVMWYGKSGKYLVSHGNDYAIAHDLKDGHEIWRVGDLNPKGSYNSTLRFVASPVATPDLIVVPSAKRRDVVGVKPDAAGYVDRGHKFEQWRLSNKTPDVPSPLVHDGLVYLCGEGGELTCVDAKSGQVYYEERLHRSRYRGSPVFADGKVYCTARDGVVSVIKAGKSYELLAENKTGDEIAASPAFSGGRIYLRGFKALYAIGK